ncbi:MAG: peptidoglycan glycosyltransferase, partial [Eggerthellaceae bacterium]|nr:peptidoglycan glycosyltransferase [Eggerthellaceae bacterium]
YNANGQRSFTASPTAYLRAVDSSVAERVGKVLESVVAYGTGVYAQVNGAVVAGKTGTAETGKPNDDSWFIGYAGPEGDPQVVVAIVLEEAVDSEWSDNAALKAHDVLETALQIKGVL